MKTVELSLALVAVGGVLVGSLAWVLPGLALWGVGQFWKGKVASLESENRVLRAEMGWVEDELDDPETDDRGG